MFQTAVTVRNGRVAICAQYCSWKKSWNSSVSVAEVWSVAVSTIGKACCAGLAPAPYSDSPTAIVGCAACTASAQGPRSATLPLYQPKYSLKNVACDAQSTGLESVPAFAAYTTVRVGSSALATVARFWITGKGSGPALKSTSFPMLQNTIDGWL